MGDFNIDILPTLAADPFQDSPHRLSKHSEERHHLEAFFAGIGMEIHVPSAVYGDLPEDWLLECMQVPITRAPRGRQHGLPSLLDYCASAGVVEDTAAVWTTLPTDHAAVYANLKVKCARRPQFQRSTRRTRLLLLSGPWRMSQISALVRASRIS